MAFKFSLFLVTLKKIYSFFKSKFYQVLCKQIINKLLKIKSAEDVIDYNGNLQKFCDEQIVDCKDVNYAKELLFAKILKTNRAHAQELIVKFKDGLKNVNNANYEVLDLLLVIDSFTGLNTELSQY